MTDTTVSDARLLPCPFCGDKAFASSTLDGGHYVMCRSENCWAMTGYLPARNEAVAAWNTRTQPVNEPAPVVTDETLFITIQDAYLRGLDWGRKYSSTEAEELKASYDYADRTTAALTKQEGSATLSDTGGEG